MNILYEQGHKKLEEEKAMDVSKSPESDDGIPKIASEDEQKAATDDEQRTDDDKQKAEEQDMSSPTETDDVDDETICPVQQKLMT